MHLLVVEDDPVIGKALSQGFGEEGHDCRWLRDGHLAWEACQDEVFDVMILDLMLPTRSGLDLLRDLRNTGCRTPVILLTALGTVEERVQGLRAGADDYMVKPFSFAELSARVEALRRRSSDRPSPRIETAGLSLDLTTRRVVHRDREIELTPTEFSLLEFLIRHGGQVVTRKMLCEHLWEADWEGETNVIEVHINRLRGKLDKVGIVSLIQTVRGRGYVLHTP